MLQRSEAQILLQMLVVSFPLKSRNSYLKTGGNEGHLARECPEAGGAPGGGSGWGGQGGGGYGGGGYSGGGGDRECYRCGGRGHIAR